MSFFPVRAFYSSAMTQNTLYRQLPQMYPRPASYHEPTRLDMWHQMATCICPPRASVPFAKHPHTHYHLPTCTPLLRVVNHSATHPQTRLRWEIFLFLVTMPWNLRHRHSLPTALLYEISNLLWLMSCMLGMYTSRTTPELSTQSTCASRKSGSGMALQADAGERYKKPKRRTIQSKDSCART